MKIGVFADVHGNVHAFEKVRRSLLEEHADMYIFCGDICGYYYGQNEVVDMMKEIPNLVGVMGNHDMNFLRVMEDSSLIDRYEKEFGRSYRLLKEKVGADTLAYLRGLPEEHISEDGRIAVFHGSPWDKLNGYVYPADPVDKFSDLPYEYVFQGHTHYPMVKQSGRVKVVNPGSCGQPRDYNMPSYALIDISSGKIEIKRLGYDISGVMDQIKSHNETNDYLIKVLERKKP